jgi:hypothetical protein
MAMESESPLDRLWREYGQVFREFDDLSLVRWMSQTLGQLRGRSWRLSHPLFGAYRLAAQVGHDRQIWLKRLANLPADYTEADCCRSPLLPLVTRDVTESGLICQHCSGTAVAFDQIVPDLQTSLSAWAEEYKPIHEVAHWDDRQRRRAGNYDRVFEDAARRAETLLSRLGQDLAPRLLDHYPVVLWEDQDECLEVRPEDVPL